jgi:predicted nucleotidyltransferase component of viral defense system
MKTITPSQRDFIDAIITEEGGSAVLLEKDIHVTDVLKALFALEFDKCRFVFCGGTSLSKAYGVIERMSEDIDLKIVMNGDHGLNRSAMKNYLRDVHRQVREVMASSGFEEEEAGKKVLNEYRYCASSWLYQSEYGASTALRPHLSLEFTVRDPQFATVSAPISYLMEKFGAPPTAAMSIECIAIEETLAEKVLSFLRRHSMHRAGEMKQDWDQALVRHIYDIYCIEKLDANAAGKAVLHFPALVEFDRNEFGSYKAFADNPQACLLDALVVAEHEKQTASEYGMRLLPLVYGQVRPDFPTAFSSFKRVSQTLLATLGERANPVASDRPAEEPSENR